MRKSDLIVCLLFCTASVCSQPHEFTGLGDGNSKLTGLNQIFINQTRERLHENSGYLLRCHRIQSNRIVKRQFKTGWEFYAKIYCGQIEASDLYGKCLSRTCAGVFTNGFIRKKTVIKPVKNVLWTKLSTAFSWFVPNWLKESQLCLTCSKNKVHSQKVPYPTKLSAHSSYRYGYYDIDIALVNIRSQMCMIKDVEPLFNLHSNQGVDELNNNGKLSNVTTAINTIEIDNTEIDLSAEDVLVPTKQLIFTQWDNFYCYLLWLRNQTTVECSKYQIHFPIFLFNLCEYRPADVNCQEKVKSVPSYHQYAFVYLMTCQNGDDVVSTPMISRPAIKATSSYYQYLFIYRLKSKPNDLMDENPDHAKPPLSPIMQQFWSNKFLYFILKENGEIDDDVTNINKLDYRHAFLYLLTCKGESEHQPQNCKDSMWKVPRLVSVWSHKFLYLISEKPYNFYSAEKIDTEFINIPRSMHTPYAFIYLMTCSPCENDNKTVEVVREQRSEVKPYSTHFQNIFIYLIHDRKTPHVSYTEDIIRKTSYWQNVFLYQLSSSLVMKIPLNMTTQQDRPNLIPHTETVVLSNFYRLKFLWYILHIRSIISTPSINKANVAPIHKVHIHGTINLLKENLSSIMKNNDMEWHRLNYNDKSNLPSNVDYVRLPQFTALILALYILLKMLIHPLKWQIKAEPMVDDPQGVKPPPIGVIRPQFYEIETIVAIIDISPEDLYDLQQIY